MENETVAPPPSAPSSSPDPQAVSGWFAGRLPDGWFTGAPEVLVDGDQILVRGTLSDAGVPAGAATEALRGFEKGRIARFREETRGERIHIARQAEREFETPVTWAARLGSTELTFTKGGGGWRGRHESGENVTIGRRGHGPFGRRGRHARAEGVVNPQVF